MSLLWSNEEVALLESVRPLLSTREIRQVFKILGYERSIDAIQKKSRKLGIYFKDFGSPIMHGLTSSEKKALKEILDRRKEHANAIEVPIILPPSAKAEKTKKTKEIMINLLEELREIRKQIPRAGSIDTKRSTSKDKLSLVVLLSDWHFGQIITDEQYNKEIYNTKIATKRIRSIPDKIAQNLTKDQLSNIDECVLLLCGDMVTGEGIFPHQEMHIHEHATKQVLNTTKATWEMIQSFRKLFPLTRIITTKGNHGRTGASPEANWDNIIYQQLELLVDMDKKKDLTIKNRYGDYNIVDVKGWKGLLRHHAPVHADTASTIAKFASWHGIHEWDFFCLAHWHHWGVMTWNGKPICRNGSLPGGDEYAERFAAYDRPTQLCFTVSKEKVCKSIIPIYF